MFHDIFCQQTKAYLSLKTLSNAVDSFPHSVDLIITFIAIYSLCDCHGISGFSQEILNNRLYD